jgi:hypothetical protein
MEKIIILDDLFPNHVVENMQSFYREFNSREKWYDISEKHDASDICLDLIEVASNFYAMDECIGYEFWTHNNTRPKDWHFDKDEKHFAETNEYKFPICSIVYYLEVNDLEGGKLTFSDILIQPKTNRIVIFPPGKFHYVQEFTGRRFSFSVNPWNYKLTHYERSY